MSGALSPTAALLAATFPGSRVGDERYLEWLYETSPFGPVIETNLDDGAGRAGHYAVVPVALTRDGVPEQGALSLNTAVADRARGGGTFTRLAEETFTAARARGVRRVIGVANANSTPGFLRRLGFRLVGPLPAEVVFPAPRPVRGVSSGWADAAAFELGGLAAGISGLLDAPQRGLARSWTPEQLRWRLASPDARYALHRTADALVISTVDRRKGVPVAVLLGVLAAQPVDGARLVRAACRFHRAPLALHVGLSDVVRFRGVPLPARLRESPLNLIDRRLDDAPDSCPFARLEFLDFDAY